MALRRIALALMAGATLLAAGPAQAAQVADAKCDGGSNVFNSGIPRWAQTFTAEHTGPLTKVRFYIATTSTVSLDVAIHSVNEFDGAPTTYLGGATVNNIPPKPATFDPLNDNLVEVSFAPGVQVTAGEHYALVITLANGSGFAIYGAAGDPCLGGTAWIDETKDDDWEPSAEGTKDLVFAAFVGDPGTSAPPPGGGGVFNPPPAPPPPTPPDNDVKLPPGSLFFVDGNTVQVVMNVESGGLVVITIYKDQPFGAAAKKKRKRYVAAKKTVKVKKAGKVKAKVRVKKAARRAIKRKGKLKVTMEIKFTPTGGTAGTAKKSITLKQKPKKKKKN